MSKCGVPLPSSLSCSTVVVSHFELLLVSPLQVSFPPLPPSHCASVCMRLRKSVLAVKCVFIKCVLNVVYKMFHEIQSHDATNCPSVEKAVRQIALKYLNKQIRLNSSWGACAERYRRTMLVVVAVAVLP
jgi:hypothetical protein